jgi:hypothetical protein
MTDTVSVTIQEDPMPVLIDTGTAAITITDATTNKITVIEANPVSVSVANGNPSVTINNGGYSGTVSVLLSDLVGKLTRTQMEPGLLSDLEKLESLWIRLGNNLILSYPDGIAIQEAGTEYTDSSIISAVADIDVSIDGKLNVAYSTITQTADAIDSRVTSIEGTTNDRIEVAESRILQTASDITSTVTRLDASDDSIELLQSSISQAEDSIELEVTAREELEDEVVTVQSSISLLSDSISLYTETLDTLSDRVTSSEIILGNDGINLSVVEQGLANYTYSLSTIQTQLNNQWGITVEEDINGNSYTSGFGIILHPAWLIGEEYTIGQTVTYSDVVYECLIANTSSSSNNPFDDSVTWVELPNGVKSEFSVNAESFQIWTNDGLVPMFTVTNGQAAINGDLVVQSIESDDYDDVSLPGFKLDPATGSADFRGMTLTLGSGSSGYSNFSDKPQSLADISTSEYALLSTAGSDSVRVSWFYSHVPTMLNAPVTDWDVADYNDHVGDLYFDTFNNNPYFFNLSLGEYKWDSLVDPDIALSLQNAADAQEAADGKVTFYYDTPVPPYQLGDFWDHTDGLKVCTTARPTGSLIATDWTVKATNGATWDTNVIGKPENLGDLDSIAASELATALSNSIQAISDASSAQDTADGKITSFYQDTEPTTGMSTGDFWVDTNDNNKLYRYTGSAWVSAQDNLIGTAITAAQTAQTTADGKAEVYYSATEPTGMSEGDLWYDTDDEQKRLYRYNGSEWSTVASYGANWGSNILNEPLSLADISAEEGGKLAGIANGADVTRDNVAKGVEGQEVYTISAYAYQDTAHHTLGGLWNEDGVNLTSAFGNNPRSYVLSVFNRASSFWISHTKYDIYGDSNNALLLANALNALDNNSIIVLVGSHAPGQNRLTNGLPDAIYRCGGSRTIFENQDWTILHPSYILVGYPGMGEGCGHEAFAPGSVGWVAGYGSVGWVETQIVIKNGSIVGLTRTPTFGALAGLDKITDTVIDSNAISASKINATNLAALSTATGALYVDNSITLNANTGRIKTVGKDSYADETSGFYLGMNDSGAALNIGDSSNYLKYYNGDMTVGGDIIATGNIKAKNVTTETINDNAVTIPMASFSSAYTKFTTHYNYYGSLSSLTIPSKGNFIQILTSVTVFNEDNRSSSLYLTLFRNNDELLTEDLHLVSKTFQKFQLNYVDNNHTGNLTYSLKLQIRISSKRVYTENRFLSLLEVQK